MHWGFLAGEVHGERGRGQRVDLMALYPLGLEAVGELRPQSLCLRLDPGFSGISGLFLLESPGVVHGGKEQGQSVDLTALYPLGLEVVGDLRP